MARPQLKVQRTAPNPWSSHNRLVRCSMIPPIELKESSDTVQCVTSTSAQPTLIPSEQQHSGAHLPRSKPPHKRAWTKKTNTTRTLGKRNEIVECITERCVVVRRVRVCMREPYPDVCDQGGGGVWRPILRMIPPYLPMLGSADWFIHRC